MVQCMQVHICFLISKDFFYISHPFRYLQTSLHIKINTIFKRYKNRSLIPLLATKLQEKVKFGGIWWWFQQLSGPPWKAALEEKEV